MRILITGGFGYVGARVAQHLQKGGHHVILGSRNVVDSPNWLSDATVVKTDWHDDRSLRNICDGVDVVIQAAGMNAKDCVANPVAALEVNGVGTARLVAAASQSGVKRFIYLSSAHVYANPLVGVFTEISCPRNLDPYATSHLAGENTVLAASERSQMEGIVLRLSNAFGAPVTTAVNCWMLLVNDLCRQAVQTGQMILRSSGLQQRDFIALEDVCRVVEYLCSCNFNSAPTGIINLGSGISQSVIEMAQIIQQRCNLVLNFLPKLTKSDIEKDQQRGILQYQSTKLKELMLSPAESSNDELNRLLLFCQASFDKHGMRRI